MNTSKDGVLERDSSDLSAIEPETAEDIDLGVCYQTNDLKLTARLIQLFLITVLHLSHLVVILEALITP